MLLAVCMENVKTSIAALLIVFVLSAIFSIVGNTYEFSGTGLFGDDTYGQSGVVVPGNGSMPAEFMPEIKHENPDVKDPEKQDSERTDSENSGMPQVKSEYRMEDNTVMNPIQEITPIVTYIALTFWHTIAAVLIGEATTMIIVLVWQKIKERSRGIRSE